MITPTTDQERLGRAQNWVTVAVSEVKELHDKAVQRNDTELANQLFYVLGSLRLADRQSSHFRGWLAKRKKESTQTPVLPMADPH